MTHHPSFVRPVLVAFLAFISAAPARAESATAAGTTTSPATTSAPAHALRDGDLVAICGDSITEQKLYSLYVQNYLLMCRPRADLRAMQFGWSGEKAPGFAGRMGNVLRFPVTVATTCYGMNDGNYAPLTDRAAGAYRSGMNAIVEKFKAAGVRFIVVGSPGAVDPDFFKRVPGPDGAATYNRTLAGLRDVAREVAQQQGVAFADVYSTMMDVMPRAKAKYGNAYPVAGDDGFHPGPPGHMIMAYAFLKALGCDGDIGTITLDLAGNSATATDGHKVISAAGGTVEVQSTRYPFCFFGDPARPDSTSGIIEFLPFNQDLNRFKLVVTNPPAGTGKLKVTWGARSKEFSSEQLAAGVNLAAEFIENPFCEPFRKVEQAAKDQQAYETKLVKSILHNLAEWPKDLPEQKGAIEALATAAAEKAKQLNDATVAAVVPVKHVIKVEAAK